MSSELSPSTSFDAIRRVRPNGSEHWSARELCKAVEYETWRNFVAAIERAKVAIHNQNIDLTSHVVDASKLVERPQGGSVTSEDFELSRFGAYMVLMNGDPRKPQIAAAQGYFAVNTRKAETNSPMQLTRADLARMVLEAEEEKAVIVAALESAAPAIAYHDRYVANGDAATVKVWAAQQGLTQPAAYQLLMDKKIVYRLDLGERWSNSKQRKVHEYEYRAYASYIPWFDLRPQHDAPRYHNGQVRNTLYVRQAHALDLAAACGLMPATK